jgi:hypothetical protein
VEELARRVAQVGDDLDGRFLRLGTGGGVGNRPGDE